MNRRRLLLLGGAGGAIGLSGCLGRDRAAQNTDDTNPTVSGDSDSTDDSDDPHQAGENEPSETGNKSGDYEVNSFEATFERIAPDHRYTVETNRLYNTVDDEHTVIDVDDLPDDVRSVLQEARADSYAADTLPDGTRTIIEEYDFVDFGWEGGRNPYVGFEVLEVDLDGHPRLVVDAHLRNALFESGDPAVIELRAKNRGEETIRWWTGAPPPFGIQWADGLLLWSDAYDESGHVHIRDDGIMVNDIAVGSDLEPGESADETYELQPDREGFEPGEFTMDGTLRCEFDGGRETIAYEVRWEILELDNAQ